MAGKRTLQRFLEITQRPLGGGAKASGPRIHYGAEAFSMQLLADAEFGDDGFVALGIVFLEVVEQATPLADQHE